MVPGGEGKSQASHSEVYLITKNNWRGDEKITSKQNVADSLRITSESLLTGGAWHTFLYST